MVTPIERVAIYGAAVALAGGVFLLVGGALGAIEARRLARESGARPGVDLDAEAEL